MSHSPQVATPPRHVVVVGAGVGGLACALDLARRGVRVTVLERAPQAGGKLREVEAGARAVDAGPTVFTMRWIFEQLFADAGAVLGDRLGLEPAPLLARHFWEGGERLDLYGDIEQSAAAIAQFSDAQEAAGYVAFCARTREIYRTLRVPFIASQRPSPLDLVRRVGWAQIDRLWRTAPLQTMWAALGTHFRDPRLRQLFGRYATYCGSSPFLAPATLMLVAHVEQDGVWTVNGGMRRIADALVALGREHAATYCFDTPVQQILIRSGRAAGVVTGSGTVIEADAVVFNGDASALAGGLLGPQVKRATLVTQPAARSLSAVTWCLSARASGPALTHHNVFFANDYAAEFSSIFARADITARPTVYLCAQDRPAQESQADNGDERLLMLINAPATGDRHQPDAALIAEWRERALQVIRCTGVDLHYREQDCVATTPAQFEQLFPGTGGALYGRANHGPFGSFARSGAPSRIAGLYLAGGSVHPGPGVPMAAMSGRLAAERIVQDLRL